VVAGVIAAGTGGRTPSRRTGAAEPLARHRHPIGAEPRPGLPREWILRDAPGQVDAARADGVNPRAVGVAAPAADRRPTRPRARATDPPDRYPAR